LHGESFNFGPKAEYIHTVQHLLDSLKNTWNIEDPNMAYKITGDIKFHEAGLLKLSCDKALYHLAWQAALEYDELISFTGSWYYDYYRNKNVDMFEKTINQINKYAQIAKVKSIKWAV